MPTIAAYIRVSSRGQTHDAQRSAIERTAAARGEPIARWFSEKASAATLQRPELDAVRAAARAGEISCLYVFRIDRLTRSGIRDTLGLVQELRGHGCRVVSVADGFSLEGPAAEVVLSVIAWAAQMERAALGERISAARSRVEAAGGHWGRRRAVDPGTLEQARQMRQDKATIRQISIALKVPRSTIADALSGKGHYGASRKPFVRKCR